MRAVALNSFRWSTNTRAVLCLIAGIVQCHPDLAGAASAATGRDASAGLWVESGLQDGDSGL